MTARLAPNWRVGFPSMALSRGAGYVRNGLVGRVSVVNGGWEATVDGSEPYRVFVPDQAHGSVATDAHCTCPWFAKGHLCKHIAAVCMALEEAGGVAPDQADWTDQAAHAEDPQAVQSEGSQAKRAEDSRLDPAEIPQWAVPFTRKTASRISSTSDLLAQASDEDVRAFLADLLAHDDQLAYRFRMRVGAPDVATAKKALTHELSQIVRAHANRGFIDYRAAYDFERDCLDAVEDALAPFERRGDADAFFTLVDAVLTSLRHVHIDDSDGFFSTTLSVLRTYWDAAFDALADPKAVTKRAKKLLARAEHIRSAKQEGDNDWFLVDQLEDYVVDRFVDDPDQAALVLDLADARIEEYRRAFEREQAAGRAEAQRSAATYPARVAPLHDTCTPLWVAVRLRSMRALGITVDEMLAFAGPHLQSQTVAEAVADLLEQAGETARAARLFERLLRREDMAKHVRRFLLLRLRTWYVALGEKDHLQEALRTLLVEDDGYAHDGGAAALWAELKAAVDPADWPRVSNEVLGGMRSPAARCDCLAAEGHVDDLAAALEGGACGYRTPVSYEGLLREDHADVLVRWYVQRVEGDMSGYASGRQAYRKSIKVLAHLAGLPGGFDEAARIAASWREEYPRRRALMEELAAAGF